MAENDSDQSEKIFDPTPRRLEEARNQGQFPFSSELVGAVVLWAGIAGLWLFSEDWGAGLVQMIRVGLQQMLKPVISPADVQQLFQDRFFATLEIMLPWFLLLLALTIFAAVIQAGIKITPEKLEIKADRLNPAQGVKKLFSLSSLVKGGFSLIKVLLLVIIVYVALDRRELMIRTLGSGRLASASQHAWMLIMRLGLILSFAILLLSVLDYLYQRFQFFNKMKMTRDELKREIKQEEGDPEIKGRIRQMAKEQLKRKMLDAVPGATAIITNPTHYAVALRYRPQEDQAPVIVAKGKGRLAQLIIDIAKAHNVPIVRRPSLARELFATLKQGQEIPVKLYLAVAEVIKIVSDLNKLRPNMN